MRSRIWTPDSYRDGAVYEVVKALDGADAIGDPDDLARIAEAVVDALSKRHADFEGWLLVQDINYRVVEIDHAATDDGYVSYMVVCELPKEGDDDE